MAQPISDGVDAPLETHSKTIDSSIFQLPHPKRKRVVITPLKLIDNYDSDEDLNLEDLDECVDSETDSDSSLTVSDGSETMVESSDSDNRSLGSEMDVSNSELVGEHGNACLYTARDGTKWFENSNSDVATLNILPSDHKAYPTEYCKDANSIKEIMQLFFNVDICNHILKMTNKKLEDYLKSHPNGDHTYYSLFSYDEILAFIGLLILSGVFRSIREPISDLYSEDPNRGKPIFPATMPRDRFKAILRFIRFDNLDTRLERLQTDKLAPIRFVFDSINSSLNKAYMPNINLTIDEHLCRYRGKCPFKQYIPSKPDKYGIKVFVLADAKTFYPLNLEIYTGKGGSSNKSEDLTSRLCTILKPGHVITGDNYFTSLNLSRKLLEERKIYYFGTIRKFRREIPKELNNIKGLPVLT